MTKMKGVPLIDALPERFTYKDDGCEVSPSCLRCPLTRCRYDDPGWLRRDARRRRDHEVLRLRQEEGKDVEQLSERFGVSARTIHRIIKRARGGKLKR